MNGNISPQSRCKRTSDCVNVMSAAINDLGLEISDLLNIHSLFIGSFSCCCKKKTAQEGVYFCLET